MASIHPIHAKCDLPFSLHQIDLDSQYHLIDFPLTPDRFDCTSKPAGRHSPAPIISAICFTRPIVTINHFLPSLAAQRGPGPARQVLIVQPACCSGLVLRLVPFPAGPRSIALDRRPSPGPVSACASVKRAARYIMAIEVEAFCI